jgi:hypothetical protein
MKAWGEGVVKRLHALGLQVDGCTADEEQVVFVPDGRLALSLDTRSSVEVALTLPARDVPGLRARFADAERALELTTVIEALPEQFAAGAAGEGRRVPASRASTDELRALLDRLEREQQALWLGWRVPRAVAVQHAALLDELLEDAVVALGGLLALVAWTPVSPADPRATLPQRRERARHDDERSGASKSTKRTTKRRARALARGPRERDRDQDLEAEPESASDGEAAPPRLQRAATVRASLRPGLRRRPLAQVDPSVPIEKGARVRVLEGPFAGKTGVVQELDGRGGARVMLGLLAVRLDVKDVIGCAEGRVRPLLSSSHRKPLPVRS